MSNSEDGVSQSSKKTKRSRRRFLRFFRLPYRSNRSQNKHDDIESRVGVTTTGENLQADSSLSGDLSSLAASSRADAVTIGSMPIDSTGATNMNADTKSIGKQSILSEPSHLDCPLCLNTQPIENFPRLTMCSHRSCMDCLRQYLMIEITESRVSLACPECQEKIHPIDVQLILKDYPHLIEKWEEFLLRRCLSVDPDCRWCPAPDCGYCKIEYGCRLENERMAEACTFRWQCQYAVIAAGCAGCPKIHCDRPGCNTYFCYHCRQEWHPDQTCDSAHMSRTRLPRLRNNSITFNRQQSLQEIKPCPKCHALISKMNDGSCNHIQCTVCGADFCWLCLQEITELHYLSPSGCTFWGTKPWSRKKKILWQLGLLIGAPLGIGLVAGVGVPAILIGFPIWAARRAMSSYANKTACKRRGIVVACVFVSILAAPILAALAVGVGVPCMLLYVYGVVPFSICRNGCYGASTQDVAERARDTLRIDLGSARQGNLSIGEASVGGLTTVSYSGSHADRNDADGASTTAIAGASITGSINGSIAATIEAANSRLKDSDHVSSLGPNSAMTSVQVHMQDNVSVHSTSSYTPSTSSTISKTSKSVNVKRNPLKDALTSLASALKGKPVVVPIEKCKNAGVIVIHPSDDSDSNGSGPSSCGSHSALVAQPSTLEGKKVNATAIVKKDTVTTVAITDECQNNKKLWKKQIAQV